MHDVNTESRGILRGRLSLVRFRDSGKRCRFDYTAHIEHIIRCWCERYPQLKHIDVDRIAISVVKCRSASKEGPVVSTASLRYPDGRPMARGRKRIWQIPAVMKKDKEALYLLKIFLPRFHDLSGEEKVSAILRELSRIDPRVEGGLRSSARKSSILREQKTFAGAYKSITRDVRRAYCGVYELFLNCDFRTLLENFGDVYGSRYRVVACAAKQVQTVA